MGCLCDSQSTGSGFTTPLYNTYVKKENCELTAELIATYKRILECCKDKGLLDKIPLSTIQTNSYTGYFQSALNYPDDYCYFEIKIQDFINNVLPKILINVPNCTE